ncbi:MAG: hypothetical protein GY729_21415 [Desulfobacteraceae bacterium]|nr:hypothetical protein [Desulfobacteraceae bacterium]
MPNIKLTEGMTMKIKIIILGLLAMVFCSPAHAFVEQRSLNLSAAGLESMKITCGAGNLYVKGTPSGEITVLATIEIRGLSEDKSQTFTNENIELWLSKNEGQAHLTSEIHKNFKFGINAVVHLTVSIPEHLQLIIQDGSGAIEVQKIRNSIQIDDNSGKIEIRKIVGDLNIHDGSGGIDIQHVRGNIELDDDSGNISVKDIQGNAVIDDGSGNMSLYNIGGNIAIEDDSGNIIVKAVSGSVTVSDGSGSINIHDVEQGVVIENDGSGSRRISNIRGNIIVNE